MRGGECPGLCWLGRTAGRGLLEAQRLQLRPGAGRRRSSEAGGKRGRAGEEAAGPQGASALPEPHYSRLCMLHKGVGEPEPSAAAGHHGERTARGRCDSPCPAAPPPGPPRPHPAPTAPCTHVPLPSLHPPNTRSSGFPYPVSESPFPLPLPGKVTIPRSAVLGDREPSESANPPCAVSGLLSQ